MFAWRRFLTVCLVALALPIQGVASAAMIHCGPSHQHPSAEAQGSHRHGSADQQQDRAQADQQRADHHADHDRLDHQHADHTDGKPAGSSGQKCSACASCCAMCALPSPLPRVPEALPAPMVFSAVGAAVQAFATDGPDRPPRFVFA
jgi:NAD-dependent dihydropyrimidine dehydrogenase PreA subunit